MVTPKPSSDEPPDFSLVVGGPLYQLWRKTHLTNNAMQLMHRRIFVMVLITWVPLFLLSIFEGHAWGLSVKLTFIQDIEIHVRLLLALPLLIMAELVVHQRIRPLVERFVGGGLIPKTARTRFIAAITSGIRLRNSLIAEILLIAFVYTVIAPNIWRTHVTFDVTNWFEAAVNGKLQPSLAGWWLKWVSLPLFQFMLLRWYFRIIIWIRFLWQVSRMPLSLVPTHPDHCGGLGFLASSTDAFSLLLLAQGTLLAGMMAYRVLYEGATLPEFKLELISLVTVIVFIILGPLLFFFPKLAAVKREGTREYDILAQRYVREFDHKWLRGGAPANESLIGSADIQSLADLTNSFAVVSGMQLVPFTMRTVLQLAAFTLLPTLPLLLTVIPIQELLEKLLNIVF